MTLNLAILIIFVILQRFFGAPAFSELLFLTYGIILALGSIAMVNAYRPVQYYAKIAWIGTLLTILVTVIIPTIGLMQLRQTYGPASGAVHDDPIQIEAAMDFLQHGRNPYVEDYTQTDMVAWSTGFQYGITNPAIYHVIALPGHLLLSMPFYLTIHGLTGWFDERIVYLLAYLMVLFLASRIGRNSVERLRTLILIGLNPLAITFLMFGRNDVLVFALLLATFLLLHRRHLGWAFGVLAAACTVKLFAWVFVPFVLAYALGMSGGRSFIDGWRRLAKPLLLFGAIVLVVIGPFAAWNLPAFYDDIVRYTNGTSPTSYPINGLGFSTMLLAAGAIDRPTDVYPFWIFQLLTVGPLLWFTLPRLWRSPRLSLAIFSATFTLLVGMFFSRFMNDNYIALVFLLAAAGYSIWLTEAHWKQTD
ncbi:MAG: DUF2029 domain-containing protein [Candidatus Kerfeldbacteria bacterium]|nr:DUF2029 domain-containing protein [Candidatus Kerfeldbacteria bacterium]